MANYVCFAAKRFSWPISWVWCSVIQALTPHHAHCSSNKEIRSSAYAQESCRPWRITLWVWLLANQASR